MYTIYTDGSCFADSEAGGWAFVLLVGETELMRDSGFIRTHHPGECEAEAVKQAIDAVPNPQLGAVVYCDQKRLSIARHIDVPDWLEFQAAQKSDMNQWHQQCHQMARNAARKAE